MNWKDANDTVGQIGGWRAYAKEAQQADGQQSQGAAPRQDGRQSPAQPEGSRGASGAANPHAGHGKQ
ncbi:hypothetical protein JI739_19610 [Ramlibacter sp. AW1]|uniref:Uncharacterized protein n=1 Tax=Ramlibacter aurantiacus TaxID=2801330 RepID=A0A936ZKJ1_9BURK|nr:hypothetical protein [Ramlibacter aurantiacus]MBL0422562.1 hypothetical protein [Ramlibacter aurantiacus]